MRLHQGHPARDRHRAEGQHPQPTIDCRDLDRDLRVPALALRPDRTDLLAHLGCGGEEAPGERYRRDRTPLPGGHSPCPLRAHHSARRPHAPAAAGDPPQGGLRAGPRQRYYLSHIGGAVERGAALLPSGVVDRPAERRRRARLAEPTGRLGRDRLLRGQRDLRRPLLPRRGERPTL